MSLAMSGDRSRPSVPAPSNALHYSALFPMISLLLLLVWPVSASPASYSVSSNSDLSKWADPCGVSRSRPSTPMPHAVYYGEAEPASDAELVDNVLRAARSALRHSKTFRDEYVRRTFFVPSWWDHDETWKDMRYDWMPPWRQHQRPKLTTSLPQLFMALQRLAVGLEQVAHDQEMQYGHFARQFSEAEYKLKAVLCEMYMAMLERNLSVDHHHHVPVAPHLSHEVRSQTDRDFRDFYIYRDYMNSLEHVVRIFNRLRSEET